MKNEGMKLKNKTALVTGGSRGIGLAIARAFLREGARVMLAARSEEELNVAHRDLSGEFGEARVAICTTDVSRGEDVEKMIAETLRSFSRIDVAVNAAGIYGPIGPSEKADFEAWKRTFEINLFGTFKVFQEVAPHMMKQRKGKIINFSGGGDGPFPRFSAYSASKVSVVRLTETLAAEMKGYGVDVNAIAPGGVNTLFLDQAIAAGEDAVGKEQYVKFLKQREAGGVSPDGAAELCVFLASDASDGLSGRFISAVWDDWRNWDKQKIGEIMASERLVLRRIK